MTEQRRHNVAHCCSYRNHFTLSHIQVARRNAVSPKHLCHLHPRLIVMDTCTSRPNILSGIIELVLGVWRLTTKHVRNTGTSKPLQGDIISSSSGHCPLGIKRLTRQSWQPTTVNFCQTEWSMKPGKLSGLPHSTSAAHFSSNLRRSSRSRASDEKSDC